MGDHEARVGAAIFDQECRQVAVGGVDEALLTPLTDVGQLMHSYGQVVQHLKMGREMVPMITIMLLTKYYYHPC